MPKKSIWDVFWAHLFPKVGFEKVLGGFWDDFWWILRVADYLVDSYFAPLRHVASMWEKI